MYASLPINDIEDGDLHWEDENVQAHIKELMECPWFEDDEGYLYIISEEIEGPGNKMTDAIIAALHSGTREDALDWAVEGLTYVDSVLKRFSIEDGFYHA